MKFKKATSVKFSALVIALLAMTVFVTRPSFTASATSAAPAATVAAGPMQFVPCPACQCFPTCDELDSRMLSLAGPGLSSFVGGELNVGFSSTSGPGGNVLIGIFDPNSAGLWDTSTVDLMFEVFADPDNDGIGVPLSASEIGPFFSTAAPALPFNLAENNWWDLTFQNNAFAQNGGTHFYFLKITPILISGLQPINGIKIRTDGQLSFQARPFS